MVDQASLKHPTLELRAPDVPTLLDDTIAIAALWRSLAHYLVYNLELNRNIDAIGRAIVVENKWRAQRYGVRGTFIGHGGAISVASLVDQVIEDLTKDATRSAALPNCSAAAPSSAPAPRPTRRWRCMRGSERPEAAPARSPPSSTGSQRRRCGSPTLRPAARSAPRGRGRAHRPRRARAARTASASAPLRASGREQPVYRQAPARAGR